MPPEEPYVDARVKHIRNNAVALLAERDATIKRQAEMIRMLEKSRDELKKHNRQLLRKAGK